MDLKNLCQNIDISSLRARIPSLPAMPQIKLPKSLPKLRSRRIFSRSREDLSRSGSSKGATAKDQQLQQPGVHLTLSRQPPLPPPIPPADFINHSPCHISTVSSLMQQHQQRQQRGDSQRGTYRSACSVDDDYPSPRQFQAPGRLSRPISPIHTPMNDGGGEEAVVKMSLTEKLQKGYKDISEFRLSHIFAKKTVVRKDVIQVDHYVERYNEERAYEQAEQERRDRKIADNYRFNFKVSRQDTDNSKRSMSSEEAPEDAVDTHARKVREQSEDESGMEVTPPPRKPGIASTRFARVRNPPLEQHLDYESNNELDEDEEVPAPRGVSQQQRKSKMEQSSPESMTQEPVKRGALNKLRRMSKSSEGTPEQTAERKRRRAPLSPQQSEEKLEAPVTTENEHNPLSALKQNIKRFSKSIRRAHEADGSGIKADETDGDDTPNKQETKHISRTEKLAARLRRFASHDASTENLDETTPKNTEEPRSPIRAVITNKLQTWKKSFKRRPNETETQTGDDTTPEHGVAEEGKRSDTLMKKLRNMRQRKRASSTDDLDGTEDEEGRNTPAATTTSKSKDASSRKTVNFEARFEQARKQTFKKMNEKMQQIKFFHKSQENLEKDEGATTQNAVGRRADMEAARADEESEDERTVYVRPRTAARRAAARDTPSDSEEEHQGLQPTDEPRAESFETTRHEYDYNGEHIQHTRALWTTKNLLTDSLDSEMDTEFPRVLIHQDNSDQFESTLIIAVTRPAPSTPNTPIIEEIHDDLQNVKPPRRSRSPSPGSSRAEWIPNNEIISTFLEITPPSQRRLSAEAILPAPRGHTRKMSMDSNSNSDSDSWIPENTRNKKLGQQNKEGSVEANSGVALNSIDEHEEPWKVHQHAYCEEKLYKTKSIDIFEASVRKGGARAAFDDFEEELRDEPILRVPQKNIDSSFEKDSSEEPFAADDDNSSRVTRISVSVIREEYEEMQENVVSKEEIKLTEDTVRPVCESENESLIANVDEEERKQLNEEKYFEVRAGDNDDGDDGDDDDVDDDEDEDDRPPSATPSPPPSMSPPPPPLPLRKPMLLAAKSIEESPPVPNTKPPVPPAKPPPRIPDRTPSMTRIAKPLVKTSSLRLAYNEQVKPSDVGKVNKLISRFETPQSKVTQRPRVIRRRLTRDESEEYTDDEDDLEEDEESEQEKAANSERERDITPTPTNTPRTLSLESDVENLLTRANPVTKHQKASAKLEEKNTTPTNRKNSGNGNQPKVYSDLPRITLNFDNNSNLDLSCASSEYGSPLEYPSSLIGSTETTPIPERRPQELQNLRSAERSRRSMTREDEKFLSFDSDDENSYYSISSSGSSRYVVEI
ncbi:zinc finger CCCH domain-containing protein 13 [Ceratitis capitata]|uniref:zinc finger CCCH domain-containing protein 13 n=1 Tax=Ceratitis capitata TaxID=7213 RepID=UPI00032A3C5E|nr:zinc finger CCCH domain-containing protein 13 [Ceratitis capitata]